MKNTGGNITGNGLEAYHHIGYRILLKTALIFDIIIVRQIRKKEL